MKQKYKHLSEFSEQEILDAIDKSSNKLDVYRNLGYDVNHLNGSLHRQITAFMKERNIPSFRPSYITEEVYLQNPKCCKYCGEIISYKNRRNDFCNQSCAAKYNNIFTQ